MSIRPWLWILAFAVAGCSSEAPKQAPTKATTPSAQPQAPAETPPKPPKSDDSFAAWVKDRLEASNPSFVSIIDHQPWSNSRTPNTSIVLGVAKRPTEGQLAAEMDFFYFPFIFLAQSDPKDSSQPARKLALTFQEDYFLNAPSTIAADHRLIAVDVTPIQILKDEYAFGIRARAGSLGNKGGLLVETVSLYRYQLGQLTQILREVVWAYSKYSEPDSSSCNVEMELVSRPPASNVGYYTITREYRRSYRTKTQEPDKEGTCSLTEPLSKPATHTWNGEKGIYLDQSGRFLQIDDLFKGWPR